MSDSSLLAVAGDLHLKQQLLTTFRDARGDTYYALQQIIDWCLTNHADLLLPGDFFDQTRQSSENFNQAQAELDRLRSAGLTAYWITGNHDRAAPPWSASLPVVDIHERTFQLLGHTFYGLDCLDSHCVEEAYRRIPAGVDVVVGHQALAELLPMDFSYRLEADWVPEHVQHVLLGHVHMPWQWTHPDRGTVFTYTGSTARLSAAEPPEKSFLRLSVDDAGHLQMERVPLKSRPFHDLTVNSQGDLDILAGDIEGGALDPDLSLPENIRRPMLRIKYNSDEVGISTLRDLLADRCYLHAIPLKVAAVMEAAETDTEVDLAELVGRFVDPKQDSQLYEFVLQLVDDGDPAAVLEKLRAELDVESASNITAGICLPGAIVLALAACVGYARGHDGMAGTGRSVVATR